jgi:Mor family transcriptional regulator
MPAISLSPTERAVLKKIQSLGGQGAAKRYHLRPLKNKKTNGDTILVVKREKTSERDAAIRAEYATHTAPQLARKYGLSVMWIREIVSGRYGSPQRRNRVIERAIARLKAAGYAVQPPIEAAS